MTKPVTTLISVRARSRNAWPSAAGAGALTPGRKPACRYYYSKTCRLAPGGRPVIRLKARLKAAWDV